LGKKEIFGLKGEELKTFIFQKGNRKGFGFITSIIGGFHWALVLIIGLFFLLVIIEEGTQRKVYSNFLIP